MSGAVSTDGSPARTLLRSVEVDGVVGDVGLVDGTVQFVGGRGDRGDQGDYDIVVDGHGGALIPGLHDHHIHVLALAAARRSVTVGPPDVTDETGLRNALIEADRRLPAGSWLRAVGFHESVAELDRHRLDRIVASRPVRVQHRSGRQWILNSKALELCGLTAGDTVPDALIECDGAGHPTGRVTGGDAGLRRFWSTADSIEDAVREVSCELAAYGVTGVTDATPFLHLGDLAPLVGCARAGSFAQRLTIMGAPGLRPTLDDVYPGTLGPVKLVVADDALPSIDELVAGIGVARSLGRTVAVHCVTRVGLVVCLAAFDEVGAVTGDRIEHGAVIDADLARHLAELGLTVVTQPNFVCERGDRYLVDVDEVDRPHLYPCASLLGEGIGVGGSTDAPFGHPDPWRAMRAAVERRTASGLPIGVDESVSADVALSLFLGSPVSPSGPSRQVRIGEVADLCLLHVPIAEARNTLRADNVRATWIRGHQMHGD